MGYLIISWIAVYLVVWALERAPFVRNMWIRFSAATDDMPFFIGTYPELRLAGTGVCIAFIGALLGFFGSAASAYFAPLAIIAVAGFIITAFGVFLGMYSIVAGQLRIFGSKGPEKK